MENENNYLNDDFINKIRNFIVTISSYTYCDCEIVYNPTIGGYKFKGIYIYYDYEYNNDNNECYSLNDIILDGEFIKEFVEYIIKNYKKSEIKSRFGIELSDFKDNQDTIKFMTNRLLSDYYDINTYRHGLKLDEFIDKYFINKFKSGFLR